MNPVMVVLLLLVVYATVVVASLVVELLTERRRFKVAIPDLLRELNGASVDQLPKIIEESKLLRRQKKALGTLCSATDLPSESLSSLAARMLAEEELRYRKVVAHTDFAAKIAPMFGLMGTLIPLGPGLISMGEGDIAALSQSLLVAFDTTVAGLIVGAFCLGVSKVRSLWYDDYMSAFEVIANAIVEKIELERA